MSSLIIVRADASQKIGSGHIMRCLVLAEALRDTGMVVEFVTRKNLGNQDAQIKERGLGVHSLSRLYDPKLKKPLDGFGKWSNIKQYEDANDTINTLCSREVAWLIVDHYALDFNWETKLRPHVKKLMVIDDLADRIHECNCLLDQNYVNDQTRYDHLLSARTIKLLGPKYSLLNKSFTSVPQFDIRSSTQIERVFIFFGSSDPYNLTSTSLVALLQPDLKHLYLDVVIGSANPFKAEIKHLVEKHSNAELHIQVTNMAEIMYSADIALGAGGITTWEGMAIGLPSIVITVADNQVAFTRDLSQDGYIQWLGTADQVNENIIYRALRDAMLNPKKLRDQSVKCRKLVNGTGVEKVTKLLVK